MVKYAVILLLIPVMMMAGCSDDSSPTSTPSTSDDPSLAFSSTSVTMCSSDETAISLDGDNMPEEVFALSFELQVSDADVITFDASQSEIGSLFGDEAILFTQMEDDVLYATVTRIQSDTTWQTEGTVLTLTLQAQAAGSATLNMLVDALVFYNEAGNEIEVEGINVADVSVTVTN